MLKKPEKQEQEHFQEDKDREPWAKPSPENLNAKEPTNCFECDQYHFCQWSPDCKHACEKLIARSLHDKITEYFLLFINEINQYCEAQMREMETLKATANVASKAKSDFLASISHEIRTPMNAVIGMSYLMMDTPLDQQQQDFMKKILRSSLHLKTVLNNILDFSKLEGGNLGLEQQEFNLQRLLDDIVALMFAKATDKSLELQLKLDPAIPVFLRGDSMRLNQILVNYIDNAIKFTNQKSEVVIEAQLKQEDEKQVLLYFAVHDNGIGLTEAQQSLIFQQFQQADISSTRKYSGIGLGLSISKSLAELMGGEAGVISEYGQGSTFWFTVRLGKNPTQNAKLSTPVTDIAQPVPPAKKTAPQIDPIGFQAVLYRLSQLLEENNYEAVELAQANATLIQALFAEDYPSFYALIENFDFEQANILLMACAKKYEIRLE